MLFFYEILRFLSWSNLVGKKAQFLDFLSGHFRCDQVRFFGYLISRRKYPTSPHEGSFCYAAVSLLCSFILT